MKANFRLALLVGVCVLPSLPAAAQQQIITVTHAVANSRADSSLRELELKQDLSKRCDGQESCSQNLGLNFEVEVIYTCRDASGTTRQIGPKKFDGLQTIELSCRG